MALKIGVCENYGGCNDALDGKKVEADEKAFICPNCRQPLKPVSARAEPVSNIGAGGGKNPKRAAIVLSVALAVVGFAIWGIMRWIEGNPHVEFVGLPPEPISFGTVAKLESVARTLTVKNSGTGTLSVEVAGRNGPMFLCQPKLLKVPSGQEKTLTITYQPQQAGENVQPITFKTNDRSNRTPRLNFQGQGAEHGPWWIWEELAKSSSVLKPITH